MAKPLVVTNYTPFQRLRNKRAELKSIRKINRHFFNRNFLRTKVNSQV